MYRVPDVVLTFSPTGQPKLETYMQSLPKLKINNDYYRNIQTNIKNDKDRTFAKGEIDKANLLIKNIAHRSDTILKIARAIVHEQIDFFTMGIMYLKPLTLSKVAMLTNFNESTVSRSTLHKYISTPNGIFELKYFFSSGVSVIRDSNNISVSSTKVKELIKQLIDVEDAHEILSDDKIAEELSKFNINIARRTVAKYRDMIGIPTSSERKRNKFIS